jgi:hypothetical protein
VAGGPGRSSPVSARADFFDLFFGEICYFEKLHFVSHLGKHPVGHQSVNQKPGAAFSIL